MLRTRRQVVCRAFALVTVSALAVGCASHPPVRASSVRLGAVNAVAVDRAGDLYIADGGDLVIRKMTPAGVITTVAGNGNPCLRRRGCGDGGPATQAELRPFPEAIAVGANGDLYIVDGAAIREVSASGTISTVVPSTRAGVRYQGLAVDGAGDVYVAEDYHYEVHRISPDGTVTTVAGDGSTCASDCRTTGSATATGLLNPMGVAVARNGVLFVADLTRVVEVSPSGMMSVRNLGPGIVPSAVAVDGAGDIFVADAARQKVYRLTPSGTLSTVAGTGVPCASPGVCGDGGPAIRARLCSPSGVAVDAVGNMYIADSCEGVRRVSPAGTITAVTRVGNSARGR